MRSFGVTAPRLQPQPPFPGQRFGTGGSAADLFFCAAWLSSTSGSHAVATPNGRRTRPQQSRARRWRRHRRRQFSHPRIAVRIRQSPASLPAVVRTGSEVGVDEGGCSPTRARARCACRSSRIRPAASTPAAPAIAAKEGSRRSRSQRRTVEGVEITFGECQVAGTTAAGALLFGRRATSAIADWCSARRCAVSSCWSWPVGSLIAIEYARPTAALSA